MHLGMRLGMHLSYLQKRNVSNGDAFGDAFLPYFKCDYRGYNAILPPYFRLFYADWWGYNTLKTPYSYPHNFAYLSKYQQLNDFYSLKRKTSRFYHIIYTIPN